MSEMQRLSPTTGPAAWRRSASFMDVGDLTHPANVRRTTLVIAVSTNTPSLTAGFLFVAIGKYAFSGDLLVANKTDIQL